MRAEGAIRQDVLPTTISNAIAMASKSTTPEPGRKVRAPLHLPAYELTTHDLPPGYQFEAWRNNFASMLEFNTPEDVTVGFGGKQVIWDLGCLAFSRIKTDALRFASLPGHTRRDPLDHWTLTMLLHGSVNTIAPTRTFEGGAGVVQVHSLGRTFEGNVTDSEMLMLFVPRDFSYEVTKTLSGAEFSTLDTGLGRLFSDFMTGLAKRLPAVEEADLPALVAATRAMILACVSPTADHLDEAREPIATALIEKAHRIIQSRLFDPALRAETLRRELGVSRSRLYRLFEPFGGVTHYIQHRRLLDAHAALSDPNDQRRIIDIAEQRCFNDGTEFSRAFRREFGCSPTDVRSGQSACLPYKPAADLATYAPAERFGVLLRRLHG
ncbi:helix-turn-helix domain-containing protein (plasmid) [Phyllobacterium sp. A18/5-2]|uniref:helix-turn-helix domain-containing protein n=1 Tax=Phyllobacterium sp. A18/5-2 TaxID=2978392 RepID=UPI0021C5D7E4|nr:helix-turn-helix domain-containing protein [Phyllobacterium sp. A18/5-2]UXN66863.1 helix-turn-helix domain-containing protein [Phyllobacterium sp. A18/5-2]